MRKFTLCADDFGLNEEVNEGILDLAEAGRINAVSCMSVSENLASGSQRLKTLITTNPNIQVGLHLTLTEYAPLTSMPMFAPGKFPSIGKLLLRTHFGNISPSEIESEISAQVDRFEDIFGFAPHFIDGHQHAHVLPGIREPVLAIAKRRLGSNGWIRACYQPPKSILSARISLPRTLLVSFLAKRLSRLARDNKIMFNDVFYGVNNFTPHTPYRKLMKIWLSAAARENGTVLCMCHPAVGSNPGNTIHDPIAQHRPYEHTYLSSDDFLKDLGNAGLEL